jgi:hypothetical protein
MVLNIDSGRQMNYFMWSTIILTVWAASGPLVGVRYGQELARRNQKIQWIADSKKKEFKELLGVLDVVFAFHVREGQMSKADKASQSEYFDMSHKAMWCIRDRLFIAKEMEENKILERWRVLMNDFLAVGEFRNFKDRFNELRTDLLKMATKDIQM